MFVRLALIGLLLGPAPAIAFDTTKLGQGGSLMLDDLINVIRQAPKLADEIDAAVAASGKTPDRIICDGMRFPGQWDELGGLRVAPYHCQIGHKWLTIRTKVRITNKNGKVFDEITDQARREAVEVKETDPTWSWSDKEPEEP
jgi:hypothetical protein